MRKITTIPSKKIAFKNVPIMGIFFVKRSLYTKISAREAIQKNNNKSACFDRDKVVRFIAKQHEQIANEITDPNDIDETPLKSQDVVEIKKLSVIGKVISIDGDSYTVQYKHNESIQFKDFFRDEIQRAKK